MRRSTREILDNAGAALTERVLALLDVQPEGSGDAGIEAIRAGLDKLRAVSVAMQSFPVIQECQTLGQRRRDLDSMLRHFAEAEPYTIEAYLPTRASLARTYSVAKYNFFRMLEYVVADLPIDEEPKGVLSKEVRATGRAAAASLIAEDVLRSIACDAKLDLELRQRSTRILAAFWDQRATRSLADFTPILASAWRAKASVEISYGTLAGVSELLQMVGAGIDSEFVDFFSGESISREQGWAFEEFLFNALYEELRRMKEFMRENERSALDPASVAEIFGVAPERLHRTTMTAEDLLYTFREREQWARTRRLLDLEGPKKTAEEYVMIYVLERRGAGSAGSEAP